MKPATLLKTRTELKIHLFRGTLIAFVIVCLLISTWNPGIHQVAADSLPAGIVHLIPITLTNAQSVVAPAMFQQMITVDSILYSSYESSYLQNIEFFDSCGAIIPSWLESGNSNSSTNTIYWLKLANGISANSKVTIYMGFADPTTNLFNNQSTGEAPQLSSIYGQYDNGRYVFNYYDNFASSSSGWSASAGVMPSVSDCITVNFSQNGYLVGPSENIGTAFDADVISNPAEINIGYINTNETTTTNYLGSTILVTIECRPRQTTRNKEV